MRSTERVWPVVNLLSYQSLFQLAKLTTMHAHGQPKFIILKMVVAGSYRVL